jgi:hypothetical protein
MSLPTRLPPSILGGDPFNQFRFLYRRELWWKLNDPDYCLDVMRAAYDAGARAFDLSFKENARLFSRLKQAIGEDLIGFGNPTWEQGVMLNGRFLQYERDRILRTLVDRLWPRQIAELVENKLSREAVMVFGYDHQAELLSDAEIASIRLDEDTFLNRLEMLNDCQYMFFGGSDADWLVSLGRADLLADLTRLIRERGYVPILLCHYATLVVPVAEDMALDTEAYAIPFNKAWSWFNLQECMEIVQALEKPVIAFMPLASGELIRDVQASLGWLYADMHVESILFGTAISAHAVETTRAARAARAAADATREKGKVYGSH